MNKPANARLDLPGLHSPAAADVARYFTLADHRVIEGLWARLAPALAALQAGQPLALGSLQADARAFIAVHAGHLALEDTITFPAAQAALASLGAEAIRTMGAEMAARRRTA